MIDILKQGIFMMNCKALFFLLLSAFPALAAPWISAIRESRFPDGPC